MEMMRWFSSGTDHQIRKARKRAGSSLCCMHGCCGLDAWQRHTLRRPGGHAGAVPWRGERGLLGTTPFVANLKYGKPGRPG